MPTKDRFLEECRKRIKYKKKLSKNKNKGDIEQ